MQHESATTSATRRVRSDKGTIALNKRDVWALTWIGQQFGVRVDRLPVLLARKSSAAERMLQKGRLAETTTRALIERWQRAGWIEKRKILAGEPAWVWLSRRGVQVLGLEYRHWEPSAAGLAHLDAINRVRLELEQRYTESAWSSERDLMRRREVAEAEAKTAGEVLKHGHMCDAEVMTNKGLVSIEVELHAKTQARTVAIMRELSQRGMVWYFVSSAADPMIQSVWKTLDKASADKVMMMHMEKIP